MALFKGDGGDNILTGTKKDDVLKGFSGQDSFYPKAGDDRVYGGPGEDYYYSSRGNDYFDGGADFDRVFYSDDPAGVTVNLKTQTATDGWGDKDNFVSVERATGSKFADTLLGSGNDDSFTGEKGDDFIDGKGGWDFVWFGSSTGAQTVDLMKGFAKGGEDNDTLKSIEGVAGSNYSDRLFGTNRKGIEEWFSLDSTGDKYTPHRSGGADFVNGRGGMDGVFFDWEKGGVKANLTTGKVHDSTGHIDRLKNIEMLTGSPFDDKLTGDNGKNVLNGGSGDDVIFGRGGNDELIGGADKDIFVFGENNGKNNVTDFTDGEDKINLKQFKYADKATALAEFYAAGDGHAVFKDGGTVVHLRDFAFADLDGADLVV